MRDRDDGLHTKTNIFDLFVGDGEEVDIGGQSVNNVGLRKNSNQITTQRESGKSKRCRKLKTKLKITLFIPMNIYQVNHDAHGTLQGVGRIEVVNEVSSPISVYTLEVF